MRYQEQPPGDGKQSAPHRGQPPYQAPQSPAAPRKRHRVFLWFFLAVQVIFLIWIIAGIANNSGTPPECANLTGNDLQTCKDATDVGTTIGVGLIIAVWAAVDFILAVTYGVYRLARRPDRS